MDGASHSVTSALEARGQAAGLSDFMHRTQEFGRHKEPSRTASYLPHFGILTSFAVLGGLLAWSLVRRGRA